MKSFPRFVPVLLLALVVSGCSTSKSYQAGVSDLYPVVAERMDKYADADEALPAKIESLRDAAIAPVRYDTASKAWRDMQPDYARHISGDTELSDFRRTEWLLTGDKLDELNAAESSRRKMLFMPP